MDEMRVSDIFNHFSDFESSSRMDLFLEKLKKYINDKYTDAPTTPIEQFKKEYFDFFIKVHARNNDHLLTIIHEKLKPVGLSHSKIILSFRQIIKKQLTVLPIEGKENVT